MQAQFGVREIWGRRWLLRVRVRGERTVLKDSGGLSKIVIPNSKATPKHMAGTTTAWSLCVHGARAL